MADVGSLWVRLGLDSSNLKAGLAQAKTDLTGWRDETNKSTADMTKWGAAIGATVAPIAAMSYAVYGAIEKFGGLSEQISDLSYTTGLSTDKIQQLQYAAVLSGTEFSALTMGVNQLTLSVSKAGDATSETGKAFAELGVSVDGRAIDQVFDDTAMALVNMENETRRNEIAMSLYGRSWKEMLPFVQDYIDKKKEIEGISLLSPEEIEANKESKAELDALGKRIETYEGKIVGYRDDAGSTVLDRWLGGQGLGSFVPKPATPVKKGEKPKVGEASPISDPLTGLTSQEAEIEILSKYTIPALEDAYKTLSTSGTASMEQIANASLAVIMAKEKLIALTTEETETQADLASGTNDLADAQDRLNDINKDYTREMSILNPRDVSAARDLTIRHNWAVEDQQAAISKASGATYGDVVVNIDGKTIARVPGVAAGTGERSLMQAGY